jgi:cell wall-associated NlpC family hydrolase
LATSGLGTAGLGGSTSSLGGLASSLDPLGSTAGDSGIAGVAASTADPRVQAMVAEANSLVGKPYVWGGGHSGWAPQAGYDCSGFVSAVLHAGGYLSSPQDTETLPSAPGIESGPGQYVTIYDRNESGQEGHVIVDIGGQFYESGGEAGAWGGGGGVQRIATPPASYLATFNDVLHPAGL